MILIISILKAKTKKMKKIIHLACLLSLIFFASCEIINPEEDIPAYFHITDFEIVENPDATANQGSLGHNIPNLELFVRDDINLKSQRIGFISIPKTVPILANGPRVVTIDPVIRANGSSLSLRVYPFYERIVLNMDLTPGVIDTIRPVTRYKPDIEIRLLEEFESDNPRSNFFQVELDGNDQTFLVNSATDAFEGGQSGYVYLDEENGAFAAATGADFEIIVAEAAQVYAEVNYKTDVNLAFGLIPLDGTSAGTPIFDFIVLPKDEWNKIYFELTEVIIATGATQFKFGFGASLPLENGEFVLSEAEVFLDNVKLIHF